MQVVNPAPEYHHYDEAKSNFDTIHYTMGHTAIGEKVQQSYAAEGYEVLPAFQVKIYWQGDQLKGKLT